jgi:hypothetical protein
MDTATASIVFSIAGGVAEFSGLGLVVLGIATDRREARTLFEVRSPPSPPERTYPSKVPGSRLERRDPFEGLQSEATQRRQTEKRIAQNFASLINGMYAMREAVDTERDALSVELHKQLYDADNAIRKKLTYILSGSIKGRLVGAGLLGLGIVFSVVGSVLSAS